jgi:hypothetical protein
MKEYAKGRTRFPIIFGRALEPIARRTKWLWVWSSLGLASDPSQPRHCNYWAKHRVGRNNDGGAEKWGHYGREKGASMWLRYGNIDPILGHVSALFSLASLCARYTRSA